MPWNASTFGPRHNHRLNPQQSAHAARIANAVLKRSGDDGMAIAVANRDAKHFDGGGATGFGGAGPEDDDTGSGQQLAPEDMGRAPYVVSPKGKYPGFWREDRPVVSRERDAEILSRGRPQSSETDLNLTPPPRFAQPLVQNLGAERPERPGDWTPYLPDHRGIGDRHLRQPQHLDSGGDVTQQGTPTGFGGPTPTADTMASPMMQNLLQRYAKMSPEQLQEMAMVYGRSPQGQMIQRLLQQKRTLSANPGQPMGQPQATPIPTQQSGDPAAGPPQAYALGGTLMQHGGVHMPERGINTSGFLHTAGPGRTDNLNILPHADSYVLPADVVSGLGEGNSLAGAKALDLAMHTGPGGIGMPSAGRHHGMGIPRPPGVGTGPGRGFGAGHVGASLPGGLRPPEAAGAAGTGSHGFATGLAIGGAAEAAPEKVPIIAAGGEYIVSPEQCKYIGGGDVKRGHDILDKFVLHVRSRTIKEMSKLKPPVKS